jgi:hypothetical protein
MSYDSWKTAEPPRESYGDVPCVDCGTHTDFDSDDGKPRCYACDESHTRRTELDARDRAQEEWDAACEARGDAMRDGDP